MSEKPRNENRKEPVVTSVPADVDAAPRRVVSGGLHWRNALSAFQHRNYRIFFAGTAVSLIGTWMQTMAESWLVYQLTNSALALGLIRFLHSVPVTAFTIIGGHIADRVDKRRVLVGTQTVSMLLAFGMFFLIWQDWVEVWHVAVFALLLGTAQAFDIPTRQSFIVELVGRKDLMNAIALNSSIFNGARVIGPAIAGAMISFVGMAGCFLLNALSFIPVIGGYLAMRVPKHEKPAEKQSFKHATREALGYVSRQKVIASILTLMATASLFGWPYSVLMPVIAKDVLGLGAGGYGGLMAANGLGAFAGALFMATLGDYPHRKRLLFFGAFGFSATIWLFGMAQSVWLAGVALAFSGWFMILFFSTANTMVQLRAPDALRGRIMGLYSFCFVGLTPFGSLFAGATARASSAQFAIQTGAMICLAVTLVVCWLLRKESAANPPESPVA